jgi:hypothetical protein
MVRLDEKILDYIKRTGPNTPIRIAQRVGSDSLIVAAILVDAVSQNKIKRSKRKAGSNRFYFFPEQENELKKIINSRLLPPDKDMIQRVMNQKVISETEIPPQEVSILSGLEDLICGFTFEYDNKIIRGWSDPSIPEGKARELIEKKMAKNKPEPEPTPPAPEPAPEPKEPEVKKKSPATKKKSKKSKVQSQKSKVQSKNQKTEKKKSKKVRTRKPKKRTQKKTSKKK